jgi:hypothetical protein
MRAILASPLSRICQPNERIFLGVIIPDMHPTLVGFTLERVKESLF